MRLLECSMRPSAAKVAVLFTVSGLTLWESRQAAHSPTRLKQGILFSCQGFYFSALAPLRNLIDPLFATRRGMALPGSPYFFHDFHFFLLHLIQSALFSGHQSLLLRRWSLLKQQDKLAGDRCVSTGTRPQSTCLSGTITVLSFPATLFIFQAGSAALSQRGFLPAKVGSTGVTRFFRSKLL